MAVENALTIMDNDARYVPSLALTVDDAVRRQEQFSEFKRRILREGVDYMKLPGTDKDTLVKPGAEKLCNAFALAPEFVPYRETLDWDKPFFNFDYECRLVHRPTQTVVATCHGSANSMESRYRWRWVPEHQIPAGLDKGTCLAQGGRTSEFDFAVDKAETGGKYGKPASYWQQFKDAIANGTAQEITRLTKAGKQMKAWEIDTTVYRVPNDDIFTLVNTLQKMSQKRAFVSAVLLATNASDSFTQDLEDMDPDVAHPASGPKKAQDKAPEPPAPEPRYLDEETNRHSAIRYLVGQGIEHDVAVSAVGDWRTRDYVVTKADVFDQCKVLITAHEQQAPPAEAAATTPATEAAVVEPPVIAKQPAAAPEWIGEVKLASMKAKLSTDIRDNIIGSGITFAKDRDAMLTDIASAAKQCADGDTDGARDYWASIMRDAEALMLNGTGPLG